MTFQHTITRRVEFHETDLAGIVHFSNFFRYMEACEHDFARSLGFSLHPGGVPVIGWPRVHAECDYKRPLRYEQEFTVQLLVREKKERAVHYDFRFRSLGDSASLARGRMVAVCVGLVDGELKALPIPAAIASLITVAPAHLLEESA